MKRHDAAAVVLLFLLSILAHSRAGYGANLGRREGVMWAPCLTWTLENKTCAGNPFDLAAAVTFKHDATGETRKTRMYFTGGTIWAFRFTGTRPGGWRFTTTSSDPDLNGHGGTVLIKPNPDPNVRGFLTYRGNQFAVQAGMDGRLEGYLFTAYMQRSQFDALNFDQWNKAHVQAYCRAARQNGFEIVFIHVNNQWFKQGEPAWNKHKSRNPDLATFHMLETIITTAHTEGCRVHLWAWGDESRKWTPRGIPGGINGPADRRLQRYIAARLGPLPGWTMGYGFDLHEWVSTKQVNAWAAYLHQHFGWQHLLCARGIVLDGAHNMRSYDGFGRNVPVATTAHGPQDYAEIVKDLADAPERPHLYEERHSYLRSGFNLDMDGTRRLLWWEAMAGGMGGFFGFYPKSKFPYPNPEQLRTHYTFWHTRKRFKLGMRRANHLCSSGGYVLEDPSGSGFVFYQENTDSVAVDLTKAKAAQKVVAVDTQKTYREIDLGVLKAGKHRIKLPVASDWAIAVGL